MLSAMKANVGKWCCGYCNSDSNQPAATFRELKKLGYRFEEVSPNRWGKVMFCSKCHTNRTHYKLLSTEPEFVEKRRFGFSPAVRKRIVELLGNRDAITGATISSVAEIDHKIPWTRLKRDIDTLHIIDEEIERNFQLLTREHNLLKDRMCSKCKETGIRPPFLEIAFWYAGDERYTNTCEGCGWHDARKWRQIVNEIIGKGEDDLTLS